MPPTPQGEGKNPENHLNPEGAQGNCDAGSALHERPGQVKLQINGEERDFTNSPSPFTLAGLVESLGMKADRVAVELNREIVPRDRWADTQLNEGDRLEVVHFVGGGFGASEELS